ncbi:uncharacterized protein H6S33_013171 [Morchella sextelata]|uniref:uncharacterized protein n=1 Tax=Morchella sextelata TaxID=1174677 RepID=UPI001D037F8A|nr:uncharacterized protein H6S33_013171 [Morchella sextelata]KAH0609685.1 hypothetical protein H6S33_013171 [Morchella sextelata]
MERNNCTIPLNWHSLVRLEQDEITKTRKLEELRNQIAVDVPMGDIPAPGTVEEDEEEEEEEEEEGSPAPAFIVPRTVEYGEEGNSYSEIMGQRVRSSSTVASVIHQPWHLPTILPPNSSMQVGENCQRLPVR